MQKRPLGRTGLEIAPLVLGTNVFGWTADEATSFRLLDAFVDAGLNAVDTADAYSRWVPGHKGGESETIIGNWLARQPGQARQGGDHHQGRLGHGPGPARPVASAGSPRRSRRRCSGCRSRRSTSTSSHWPDPDTPFAETLGAFGKLIDAGKVAAIGASNLDAAQLARGAEGRDGQRPAALRGAAARLQPLRPRRRSRGRCSTLCRAEGHRRHHLLQPRQGLPVRQVPLEGRPREEPARRRRRRTT